MLKGRFFVVLLLAAVIGLAACGTSPTSTYPAPGGTFPAGTEPGGTLPPIGETPSEEGTMGVTEPVMTEPAMTEPAMTEPVMTDTVEATQPAVTETVAAGAPETTGTAEIPVTGGIDPGRATQLIGLEVMDSTGAAVGKVDDVLFDLKSGAVYVVVSATGSTSGNLIPAPLEVFSWDAASSSLSLAVDTATFSGAPGFQTGAYPNTQQSGWDSTFSNYWQPYAPTQTP